MTTRGGASFLAIALALLPGCAVSLVRGGQIRAEPFDEIVTRTASARGDTPPAHVDTRVVDGDEVTTLLRASLARKQSPDTLARYQENLVSIGLWPPDRDLITEYLLVARDEVAGFYLPETGMLYVVEEVPVPFAMRIASLLLRRDLVREAVLTHELVHLFQHRAQPSVFDFLGWLDQDDATAAVQAAVEGDATHYGYLAVLQPGNENLLPAPADLQASVQSDLAERTEGALVNAPGLLRLTLTFPYVQGYPLSLDEGTELLDDPPASTEQVLHAERRRAAFQVVNLAGLEHALPEGCESLGQNTLGELGIWVLLSDLGAADAADAASVGWDGDRYVAARCAATRAFHWWTSWDSEADATEFEHAYRGVAGAVAARAEITGSLQIERVGAQVSISSGHFQSQSPDPAPAAQRARIASLAELREFYGLPSPAAPK